MGAFKLKIIRSLSLIKGSIVGALLGCLIFLSLYLHLLNRVIKGSILIPGLFISILLLLILLFVIWKFLKWLKNLPIVFLCFYLASITTLLVILVLTGKFLPFSLFMGLLIITFPSLLGYSIDLLFRIIRAGKRLTLFPIFLFCLLLLVNIAFGYWLYFEGTTGHLVSYTPEPEVLSSINLPEDPSIPGDHRVEMVYYGSGRDKQRFHYRQLVTVQTRTVAITPLLSHTSTIQRSFRANYWGFDIDRVPLNGVVWYPQEEGKYPLVLIVHGNHTMYESSELGYEYLGRLLASKGYIVAAIDQNYLNLSLLGEGFKRQELNVRAWLVLEHLKLWSDWSKTPNNPFYEKIDFESITLIGHSRGGEAVAVATLFNKLPYYPENANITFNYNYPIKSVVALAPSEGFYQSAGEPVILENVNYLLLQGAADGDLLLFLGARQYNRIRFTADNFFKSLIYIYRANHGYFNSKWGRTDLSFPFGLLLNKKQIMTENEQQKIAKLFITAFLEATIRDNHDYLPLFQNSDLFRDWLPDTIYLSRYADSSLRMISDFSEDVDLSSTTLPGGKITARGFTRWWEQGIPLRCNKIDQEKRGVFLHWARRSDSVRYPVWEISLPDNTTGEWLLSADDSFLFSMSSTNYREVNTPDLSIVLTTSDNISVSLPLSNFRKPLPLLRLRSTKLGAIENFFLSPAELIPNTYFLPLSSFMAVHPSFDPAKINQIEFVFDQSIEGEIVLTDIGFTSTNIRRR